ncbi:MAG: 4'-phosphopantetheinyl transferase EntD, partial [Planctomycetota bacterium]
ALDQLGYAPTSIPPAADRSPIWPTGIVGTITHTRTFCAVAIAELRNSRCLGLDVEEYTPLKPELVERICSAREIAWIEEQTTSPDERGRLAKLFFSAKEAFYKSQYPLTGRFLEFQDVELSINLERQSFTALVRSEVDELPADLRMRSRFLELDQFIVCAVEA